MNEQNSWSVSSMSLENQEHNDLSALAGRWNENLHVTVSLPNTVTRGPIVDHMTTQEKQMSIPRIFQPPRKGLSQ
jgi:hypothetical protein